MSAQSTAPALPMDWLEIYDRLTRNAADPAAWTALEYRVRPWARAALWQHGTHVVDDAVLDTCADIFVSLSKARGRNTFHGFAYGQFLAVRRRLLRTARLTSSRLEGVDVPVPTDDEAPDEYDIARLWHELGQLPPRERRAVVLRYLEGLSAVDVAVELGTTHGNARQIICQGLVRLRKHYHARPGRPLEVR